MSISRKSMPSLEAEALFREWWTLDTNTPSNLLHFQCPTVVITAEKVEVQDLKLMYNMWDSYTSLWTGTRLHSFLNKSTGTISVASSVGNLDGRWYSGSWHHSCMYMSWLQGYIYWWGEEYVSGCDYLVHCNMSDFSSTEIAYLELHFNNWGILLQKVMAQKLNKLHLNRLSHKEQCVLPTFNRVMSEEHNHFNLENPLDYAFLSLSGCYWLPYGPFSDNSITVGDLHVAKHTLGFKPKHMSGIFCLLVTILMLGNIQFLKANHQDISAYIYNLQAVDITTQLLGVSSKDLNQTFTNKTNYVH